MTVVRRRVLKPQEPARAGRGRRAPLHERFPRGQRVQVREDFSDARYAEKLGAVVKTVDDSDDIYPRGRVAVKLVWHDLVHKLFGGKAPNPVWFNPHDLERL